MRGIGGEGEGEGVEESRRVGGLNRHVLSSVYL